MGTRDETPRQRDRASGRQRRALPDAAAAVEWARASGDADLRSALRRGEVGRVVVAYRKWRDARENRGR
jgi:hypothetical protein